MGQPGGTLVTKRGGPARSCSCGGGEPRGFLAGFLHTLSGSGRHPAWADFPLGGAAVTGAREFGVGSAEAVCRSCLCNVCQASWWYCWHPKSLSTGRLPPTGKDPEKESCHLSSAEGGSSRTPPPRREGPGVWAVAFQPL